MSDPSIVMVSGDIRTHRLLRPDLTVTDEQVRQMRELDLLLREQRQRRARTSPRRRVAAWLAPAGRRSGGQRPATSTQ